ncbi:hypothetical protein I302_100910 [Kwoniella bestiolae CBS 10118]|uniref:Uncharacterized protein n=1 Tax=Kwoniella bestiolae CBS 10118 TaxID=1296100 RepID=A0A1B9G6G6_9TREE|nr:hypothetical protein I302_04286 [Kwoniella bestiolae CBS 10118]OCF26600.1 hypothetical protein I302_04286 [Kwoniella bestiolae CBS 10118]
MSSTPESVFGVNYRKPYILYSVGSKWLTYRPEVKSSVYMGTAAPGSSNDPRGFHQYVKDAHHAHSKGLYHSSETVISNAEPSMSILRVHALKDGVGLQLVSEETLNEYNSIVARLDQDEKSIGAVLLSGDDQSIRGYVKPDQSSDVMDKRASRVIGEMQRHTCLDEGVLWCDVGDREVSELPFLIK